MPLALLLFFGDLVLDAFGVVLAARPEYLAEMARVPLLTLDDLGMRKLTATAAEDLVELVMRRYERASTLVTSNRPITIPNLKPR